MTGEKTYLLGIALNLKLTLSIHFETTAHQNSLVDFSANLLSLIDANAVPP
jgi:hypothetical protein